MTRGGSSFRTTCLPGHNGSSSGSGVADGEEGGGKGEKSGVSLHNHCRLFTPTNRFLDCCLSPRKPPRHTK